MTVELNELHSFLVLAEELHFRRAAERLFLSQPALSKKIRKLEEKVQGPLFTRTRRRVLLTEAGRVLLPKARHLVQEAAAALTTARAAAEGRAGELRIGFGIASVSEILPRTILRFRRNYPQVELQMRDMSSPSQVRALLDGSLDLGILRVPVSHPELTSVPLFREHLVLVTPASIPNRANGGLARFRDKPFILLPRSTSETLHDHVLTVCRLAQFTPHVVQEASEIFTILNLVRAGLGVSLVPSSAIRMNVPGVQFHELGIKEATWRIGIAWKRDPGKRALILRFMEIIRAVVRSRAEFGQGD